MLLQTLTILALLLPALANVPASAPATAPSTAPASAPTTAPAVTVKRIQEIKAAAQPRLLETSEVSDLDRAIRDQEGVFLGRLEASALLAERAQLPDVPLFLDSVRAVAERLTASVVRKDQDRFSEAVLKSSFRDAATVLVERLPDPKPVYDLGIDLLGNVKLREVWPQVFTLIASGPVDEQTRRQYVLKAINALPDFWRAPHEFFTLVTPEMIDSLRETAFHEGPQHGQLAHMPALDLLVECGDLATVPLLKQRATEQGKLKQYTMAGDGMIWRIEAQHKPQMLLDFMASEEWVGFASRSWVLEKAVQIGVDKDQIRSAILAHAAHIEKNRWFRSELSGLKRDAIRLGVFRGDELPDIPLPTTQPDGKRDRF